MEIKSILKPEGSIVSGVAVAGLVYAVYEMHVGSVAQAHATEPNHPSLESSRKKAGYLAFGLISAISLITRDGNVAILGYGSIVAMELAYRHAIMTNPVHGQMEQPVGALYQAAASVVPAAEQGSITQYSDFAYAS